MRTLTVLLFVFAMMVVAGCRKEAKQEVPAPEAVEEAVVPEAAVEPAQPETVVVEAIAGEEPKVVPTELEQAQPVEAPVEME